jgi:hypothetical protein
MSETDSRTVEIELDVPLRNVNEKKTFFGKVKVTREQAEDLKRREHEYHQYERGLIRNNGRKIDAGSIVGGGE